MLRSFHSFFSPFISMFNRFIAAAAILPALWWNYVPESSLSTYCNGTPETGYASYSVTRPNALTGGESSSGFLPAEQTRFCNNAIRHPRI